MQADGAPDTQRTSNKNENNTVDSAPPKTTPPLAITMGEPAGIGPELCLRLLADASLPPIVIIGDAALLESRARALSLPFSAPPHPSPDAAQPPPSRAVWHLPLAQQVPPGAPHPKNAEHILTQLRLAADGCLDGTFSAMVTAPISKETILAAGIPFVGQTEFLAEHIGAKHPVMVLAAPDMRIALATTHLPLRQVPDALTTDLLIDTLTVLHHDLPRHFVTAIPPRIDVCALNPHAGEGGHLGDEEQRIIKPAIESVRAQGMNVHGPFPADTMLPRATNSDCVLAMYHDQGLPVVKAHDFAHTINTTLGLPLLRTSPDHGVALDIAGTGTADPTSMLTAVKIAAQTQQ